MGNECSIRVFLLGDFAVLRSDGSLVADGEWRSTKNRDLIRLLALENGQPVPRPSILNKLWAGGPPNRTDASLATAISHLRRILGSPCIVRRGGGVMLECAWVDVAAFEAKAAQVRAASHLGNFGLALALVKSAEHLHYVGDFHASDDDSAWAQSARAELSRLRGEFLANAADAALALGQFSLGLDYARAAVHRDPSSERAHQVLMRAHAELGEVGAAVRVFESYRVRLADEHHAVPSAQTINLYMKLLRDGR